MLTTDLIRVRRKKDQLTVVALRPQERTSLVEAAERYIALAQASIGKTQAELLAAWDDVRHDAKDFKLHKGLRKLLLDRCTFAAQQHVDPRALRKSLFMAAAQRRQTMGEREAFDAQILKEQHATANNLSAQQLSQALYADLSDNHQLTTFEFVSGQALVEIYERSQQQAVLLRARRVVVHLKCPDAAGYRVFFRKLKFHRLLFQLFREDSGHYRIEIDGPFSLFTAVTKYGLQLAMLLPALEQSGVWRLWAEVVWDKEVYNFELSGTARNAALTQVHLADDTQALLERFEKLRSPWRVQVANDILHLPGAGLCVPDLLFEHSATGRQVYLEVMGFWSRQAVWQRVELVQSGLAQPVLFAVSSRLRVSEEVLDQALPSQLYVYKGTMSAATILERLELL